MGSPWVCDSQIATLYARADFFGPHVSLGCSPRDLSSLLCFPIRSIAVRPGATLALYSQKAFHGSVMVVHADVADVATSFPYFLGAQSASLCKVRVNDPISECPESSTAVLLSCPEELPLGVHSLDPADLGVSPTSEDTVPLHHQMRFAQNGKLVLKYLRPRARYWFSSGPESCFYKTAIREAQLRCMPPGQEAFQSLANEFIPRYHGTLRNYEYAGGEWLVMSNMLYGLENPNVLDVDPGLAKCAGCGLAINRLSTYQTKSGRYHIQTKEMLEKAVSRGPSLHRRKATMHQLMEFFYDGERRVDAAKAMLPLLKRLHGLLEQQTYAEWAGTSIMLIYGRNAHTRNWEGRVALVGFQEVSAQLHSVPVVPDHYLRPPAGMWIHEDNIREEDILKRMPSHKAFVCGALELQAQIAEFALTGVLNSGKCLSTCLGCTVGGGQL
eukprot:jgi/Mesvir1/16154/Mv08425-RA.1